MLVRQLPAESATAMAERGNGWTVTDALLANALDALNAANYQRAVISGAKSVKPPEPYPRPWTAKKLTANEWVQRLQDQQERLRKR